MFQRIKTVLLSPSAKYSVLTLLFIGFIVGFVTVVGTVVVVDATGTNDFCTSCHELNTAYEEYKDSVHYANRVGVSASCADCHLTHEYPKKLFVKATKLSDVWHHLLGTIDTPEKYEANRLRMARIEWNHLRSSDSETCRYCHGFENMAQSAQSQHANAAHQRAQRTGKTCIDCHIGIAHKLPEIPLPEAAKPAEQGQPVQCSGCHQDIQSQLSANHPKVEKAALAQCIQCHVPGSMPANESNRFYSFLHASHKNRLSCTGCHKVTQNGFKLLVSTGNKDS